MNLERGHPHIFENTPPPFQLSLKDSPSNYNKTLLHDGNWSNNFQILYIGSWTNSI